MTNEEFSTKIQEFRDKINGARADANRLRSLLEEEEKFIRDYDIARLEAYVDQIDEVLENPDLSQEHYVKLLSNRAGTVATLEVLKGST